MIASKFGIGQQVRHQLLGFPGVVVDVDPEYSLTEPSIDEVPGSDTMRDAPWYHVVMEDEDGQTVQTYLAEAQLAWGLPGEFPDESSLDELAESLRQQLLAPRLRN